MIGGGGANTSGGGGGKEGVASASFSGAELMSAKPVMPSASSGLMTVAVDANLTDRLLLLLGVSAVFCSRTARGMKSVRSRSYSFY